LEILSLGYRWEKEQIALQRMPAIGKFLGFIKSKAKQNKTKEMLSKLIHVVGYKSLVWCHLPICTVSSYLYPLSCFLYLLPSKYVFTVYLLFSVSFYQKCKI
jgi:hypothetical protein